MDKVVFITGASSGFGLSVAKMFIKDGYKVYGVGLNEFELEGLNYQTCDVRNFEQVKQIVDGIVENYIEKITEKLIWKF